MSIDNPSAYHTAVSTHRYAETPLQLSSTFRPARQLCRIFREQTFDAVEAASNPVLSAEDIHDARKCIKRARATLRLVRSAIGEESFAREDKTLQAAADSLDALRDSEVALRTIDDLVERCKEGRTKAALQTFRLQMQHAHRESRAARSTSASRAVTLLEGAATRSRGWIISDAWYSATEAVEQIYKRARRAYRQAVESPDQHALHGLRKRTQDLRYALEELALQPSGSLRRSARRRSRLVELLGEDHDLAMLQRALNSRRSGRLRAASKPVAAMIQQRRTRLQERALRHASRLYRDKPARFAVDVEQHRRPSERRLRN